MLSFFHTHPYAIQLIGFAAIGFAFAIFQVNTRKKMLVLSTISCFFWVCHFFLLGAYTGSAMNLLTAGRNYTFYKLNKKRKRKIFYGLIAAFIVADILTWSGPKSLLPLAGSVIGTIAFWQLNPRKIRLIIIFGPCCWFVYNIIIHSYAGMAADTTGVISILVGIYRFDIRPQLHRRDPRLRRLSYFPARQ
jgi:hypothetical protein